MAAPVFPWWVELTTQRPRQRFGRCPKCSGDVDSTDVLCPQDDVSLLGEIVSEEHFPWLVNTLRAVTAGVALAVGYLHWAWPVYVFTMLVAGGLATLFARNHALPRRFMLVGIATFTLAHCILMSIANGKYVPAAVSVFAVLAAIGELAFVFAFTREMATDSKRWHTQHVAGGRTMLFGAISMSAIAVTILAVLIARMSVGSLPIIVASVAMYIATLTTSVGVMALFASAVAYTLNAPAFAVRDPITYHAVLAAIRLPRLRAAPSRHIHDVIDRMVATLERVGISFANAVIASVERFHNRQLRGLVNGTIRIATALANATYRGTVKTARHVHRTLARFAVLASDCAQWGWVCASRYARSFLAPAVLFWIAAVFAWTIAQEVLGYVTHVVSAVTPLLTAFNAIFVIALLTCAAGFLVQAKAADFAAKVMSVVSAFSANAFLFFVALAWTLGVLGTITDGPYRIGWVTLTSTAIVVAIVGTAWWRGRPALPPTSP